MVLKFLAESKIMKRWAIYTVLLYALALILLTAPAILISLGITLGNALTVYANFFYWLWLAVLVAGQFLLLLVPIDISEKRLPARRKLKIPVLVSAFFLGMLSFSAILSVVLATVAKDKGFDYFNLYGPDDKTGWGFISTSIITLLVFWLIWAIAFRDFSKSDTPHALIKRAVRWLLRGSILELLVAVPSHVIVRRRDDCCAPIGTFWGIATGISVMLLCFGPGVYFLFVERMNRLQPKSTNAENLKSN